MRENNQLEEVERKEEVSVRKPYNVRERKIKEAAYRDMIRAELFFILLQLFHST